MGAQTSIRISQLLRPRGAEGAGRRVWLLAQPWVWVVALTAVAFLLRRYRLGAESFWFDEADIVRRAQQPPLTLIRNFTEAGENGPLYTLLLHYWLAFIDAFPPVQRALHLLFGSEMEAPVRGLSAIFGTAAIPLIYALARRVAGSAVGLASAALLTFNPFHIWHSQDAKMYTLLVLTSLASTILYVDALRLNTKRLWVGYVLATWVMLTVHSMAGLVLLAQLAATPFLLPADPSTAQSKLGNLKSKMRRGRWVGWGWAMLLILGPLFPLVWLRLAAVVTNTVDVGGWYASTSLPDILSTIFVTFAVNRAAAPWETIGAVGMGLLALAGSWALIRGRMGSGQGLGGLGRGQNATPQVEQEGGTLLPTAHRPPPTRPLAPLLFALYAVPVFVFWLITLKVPLFQSRYLIMALPPYLIMAGAGLVALWRLHWGAAVVAAGAVGLVTLSSFAALSGVNYSAQVQKEDWRGAMVYVQDHLRLRDAVVVFPGYLVTAVNVYYHEGGPGQVPLVPIIANLPSMKTQGFGDREMQTALREAISGHERIWLVTSPEREAQEDPQGKVQNWFQQNWHTFDTKRFNGVTVYGISFDLVPDVWFPSPDYPEVHTFSDGLMFMGYIYEIRADATQQRDASYFPLTLYWRNPTQLKDDLVFRVQIKDKAGNVIVDDAQGPLNGYRPTTEWRTGSNVIDYRDLRLPGGMTPGNYTITLQAYPKGHPDQPFKIENGSTEIVFGAPLPVVPWKP